MAEFKLLFTSIILLASTIASAAVYDTGNLTIFSKLIPRVIVFSSQYKKISDSMNICILHSEKDISISNKLAKNIDKSYPNGIKSHTIDVKSKLFIDVHACKNAQLIFLLNTDKKTTETIIKFSNKHHILTMSYSPKLLDFGVSTSISIRRYIKPYLNLKKLRDEGITIRSTLLNISKIYKSNT